MAEREITIKEYDLTAYPENHGESRFEAVAKTSYDEWMVSEIRGRGDTRDEALEDFYRAREEAKSYRDRFLQWAYVRDNPVSTEVVGS